MDKSIQTVWKRYDVSYPTLSYLLPDDIQSQCKQIAYSPNEVIVNEGETLTYIYFIKSGVADGMKRFESGKEYQYFKLDRNNGAIGLLELFSQHQAFVATVVAKTDVALLCISASVLYRRVMNDIDLLRRYSFHIANDLYHTSGRDAHLFYQSGLERVCSFLKSFYEDSAVNEGKIVIDQTYQLIANQIGVSARTIGRAIRRLKANGLCSLSGKRIQITWEQYNGLLRLY